MTSFLMDRCTVSSGGVLDLPSARARSYDAVVSRRRKVAGSERFMLEIRLTPDPRGRFVNTRRGIDISSLLPGRCERDALATGERRGVIVVEVVQLDQPLREEVRYVFGRQPDRVKVLRQ
jgi:hypothetical protein